MAGKLVIAGPKLQQGLKNVVQDAGGAEVTSKSGQGLLKQGLLTTAQTAGEATHSNNYTGYFKVILEYETKSGSNGETERKPYILVIDGHNPDYKTDEYPCGYINHNNVVDQVPVTRIEGDEIDLEEPTQQWVCLEVRRYAPEIWFQIKLMKEEEIIDVESVINFRKLAVLHKTQDEKTKEVTISWVEQIIETEYQLTYDMYKKHFRLVRDNDPGKDSNFYSTRTWHIRDGETPDGGESAGSIYDKVYQTTQDIPCEDIEIAEDGATYVYLQYDVSSYPFVTEYITSNKKLENGGNLWLGTFVFLQQIGYFFCEDMKITDFSQTSISGISLDFYYFYREMPGFYLSAKLVQEEGETAKVKPAYRISGGTVTFGSNVIAINGIEEAKAGRYFLVVDCSEGNLSGEIVLSEDGNYSADDDTTYVEELGEIKTDDNGDLQRAFWSDGDRTITYRWY